MTFGTQRADALLSQLRERHGDRLPEPEHGEEWSDYLRRLEERGLVHRYNRNDAKDLRIYRQLKRAEARGVSLIERTSDTDETHEGLNPKYQGRSPTEKFELYKTPDTVSDFQEE